MPLLIPPMNYNDEIPLSLAIGESRWETAAKKQLEKMEKEAEKEGRTLTRDTKIPFMEGIRWLEARYKEVIVPLADWNNKKGTAEMVYNAILEAWREARDKYDIDGNDETLQMAREWIREGKATPGILDKIAEFGKIKQRLDAIHQEWLDDPQAITYVNKKTFEELSPEEMEQALRQIKHDKPEKQERDRAAFKHRYEDYFRHKIGKEYGFMSEKEHMAGIMAWWLTAGAVGGSRIGERRPDFGAGIRWQMTPDSGGTAHGQDWERKGQADKAAAAASAAAGPDKIAKAVGAQPGTAGQGHIMRDPETGRGTQTPAAASRQGVGHGTMSTGQASGERGGGATGGAGPGAGGFKKRKKPAEEGFIGRLAAALSEDPNETWDHNSPVLSDDWAEEMYDRDIARRNTRDWRDNAEPLLPSNLAEMSGYASIVEDRSGRTIFVASDIVTIEQHPSAYSGEVVRTREVPEFISDDDFIIGGDRIEVLDEDCLYETDDPAAAAAAAADPNAEADPAAAATAPAAAAKPDPAIEKAKQDGGKLVDGLVGQLKILAKAPDWDKVKADLVGKLKPFLG